MKPFKAQNHELKFARGFLAATSSHVFEASLLLASGRATAKLWRKMLGRGPRVKG